LDGTPFGFGAYVHIPFCERRCDYCDFATWTDRSHLIDEYLDACVEHARTMVARRAERIEHVFFGGGTPSLVPPERLVEIVAALEPVDGAEITVEVNPDSFTARHAEIYARSGINRISIGVQSMDDTVLTALGRTHDRDNVARAVDYVRDAGIAQCSLDLIYGSPAETLESWVASVRGALALRPDHLSCYALTVEPGTPLGKAIAGGVAPAPDDDAQADRYELIDELCETGGLEWYEISNWARPGSECRHNQNTWAGGAYLAIGAAAHGFVDGSRYWNVRTPERYIEAIQSNGPAVAGTSRVSEADLVDESLMLGLRTRTGVDLGDWAESVKATARQLIADGVLALSDRQFPKPESGAFRVALTQKGRLLASHVITELAAARAES